MTKTPTQLDREYSVPQWRVNMLFVILAIGTAIGWCTIVVDVIGQP
jgi:hypothetical protein